MPSIFDKISEALMGSKSKQTPNPSTSSSTADNIEENTPPSAVVEDAMSLPSFQQVVEENNEKLTERTQVPIEYLTNYLRDILEDEKRTTTAEILLKELLGVKEHYKEDDDRVVVGRVMAALQRFASDEVNNDIRISNLIPIHVHKAKLLPKLFEDFTQAFRWKELIEEKKQNPSTRFKP